MNAPDDGFSESQPSFGFEIEDQTTHDLMLLVDIADDFGGDLQVASGLVCHATTISGVRHDADRWVRTLISIRERGTLRPDLRALSDEEFIIYAQQSAVSITERNSSSAAENLRDLLARLGEEAQLTRAYSLLEILGLRQVDDSFQVTERDEERVATIIKTAKLMDVGYREFVGANPLYMSERDPEIAAELQGTEGLLDPRIQQVLRELRHEL